MGVSGRFQTVNTQTLSLATTSVYWSVVEPSLAATSVYRSKVGFVAEV
jgi:hypothetical protein